MDRDGGSVRTFSRGKSRRLRIRTITIRPETRQRTANFVFEIGEGDFGRAVIRLSPDASLQGVRLGDFLNRLEDIWLVN